MTQEMTGTHEKDVCMDVVTEKEEETSVNEVQEESEPAPEGSVHEGDDRDNRAIKGDDEASETDSQLYSEESGKKSEDDNLSESNSDKKKKRGSKGRIFQCTGYPDCNMSFTRSEHLARHKRKHTGERPFTCPHCSKNFSRLDNLRQHKQTVHGYGFVASKKGTRSNSQHSVFSHHVHSSENNSPATSGMQASDLGHAYSSIPHGSIPMTPMTHMYNQTHSTPLISPPNSNSPVNYQVYQPYGAYGSAAFNNNYQNPNSIGGYNNYNSYPMHHQPSKEQQIENKPKRRPKPLELSHSFIRNSDSKTPSNDNLYLRSVLKSAPAIHYDYGKISKSYSPISAGLSPSLKSPLSPLFRQAFNQSKDIPLRSPYYAGPQKLGSVSAYSGTKMNNPLPSFQHLPIPTHFSPLSSNNDNNNKANNNDHNNSNISNDSSMSYSDDGTSRQNTNTNTNVAFDGKINNERYESSRALNTKENQSSGFSDSRPVNSEKPVTVEKTYESKKPSISVLLSPNDDDKFPR